MTLRRRRRRVGVSTRNAPIRPNMAPPSCRLARQQRAAAQHAAPGDFPLGDDLVALAGVEQRQRTARDRRARARRRSLSAGAFGQANGNAAEGGDGNRAPCACRGHSDAPRHAPRRRQINARTRRPLHRSLRDAREREGSSRNARLDRSDICRLPFDAPKRSHLIAARLPRQCHKRRRNQLKNPRTTPTNTPNI